jgi:hypothetical protein
MTGCNTGRNIQKYKGGGASTLQDALENSNTASLNINLSSPAVFVGDGGGLSNINASATSGNLQAVTDNAATTTNKITLTNGLTSLVTSGNVLVTGNVTASFFRGDGGTLSNVAANKNFQEVTDFGSTSSNKITLTNGVTSLQASGNVSVTGNVTASKFYGDGITLTGVALSTDLASNSTRIGTVSTDLTSNASRIGVLETDLESNSTRIGTVTTDLASNASRIGVVETDLTSNASRIGVVETDLVSNSVDLTSNALRIGVVETDLASNSTRIGTVSTDLASNSTRIGTVSTDLASNSTRIGTVSTDLASNSTRIGTVSTNLASNSTRIGTVSTDLVSNSTRIDTVSTDLESNASRIGVVETDLVSNSIRIGTVSTDLTSNASRIGVVESETQPVNRGGTGQTSYTVGQILVASGTAVLSKLTPGTSGHFLKSQGAGSALVWGSVADVGSATPGELITGSYLTGGPHTGASDTTIAADATTTNTASKLVARDSSGDIFVQNLYTDGGIQLGHASDTTLARSEAGKVTIEGAVVRTGTVAVGDGGTGSTSASAAASALGVGTEDSPQFTAIELGHASDTTLARSSAGVVTIEGVEIRTGTVPIGKGGTGAGSASAAASALGVGTEDSPQFTAIQLGHASDTTIARSSAGVVTIEGVEIRTGTVPIAKGGTGAGSASAAASALGVGTEDSPQFTAIQLGHTSDTTLARSSAGVVTIEGAVVRTGTVAVGDGGTGLDTVTAGDILYASADNTIAARAKGDNGQFLKLSGGVPVWDSVSVSSTTISTTDVTVENTDHGLIFVSDSGTGAQALKKEYGTLKYKPSSGTLTTSNIVTSDTSIHARNGIANTTPTHTLSVGTVVSIRESASGDVIIVRGDGYFGENVYIAKKLTIPAGGEIVADKITVRSLQTKGSVVIADRPPTSGIVLS